MDPCNENNLMEDKVRKMHVVCMIAWKTVQSLVLIEVLLKYYDVLIHDSYFINTTIRVQSEILKSFYIGSN